jgi:hypothetical protein
MNNFKQHVRAAEKGWYDYSNLQIRAGKHHYFTYSKMFWFDSPIPEHITANQRRHYNTVTSSTRHRVQKARYARDLRRRRANIALLSFDNGNYPF